MFWTNFPGFQISTFILLNSYIQSRFNFQISRFADFQISRLLYANFPDFQIFLDLNLQISRFTLEIWKVSPKKSGNLDIQTFIQNKFEFPDFQIRKYRFPDCFRLAFQTSRFPDCLFRPKLPDFQICSFPDSFWKFGKPKKSGNLDIQTLTSTYKTSSKSQNARFANFQVSRLF